MVAHASDAGKLRSGAATGLVVLLGLLVWVLRVLARRRSRRNAAARDAAVEADQGPQNEEVTSSPAG